MKHDVLQIPAVVPLALMDRLSRLLNVAEKLDMASSSHASEFNEALQGMRDLGTACRTFQKQQAILPIPRSVFLTLFAGIRAAHDKLVELPPEIRREVKEGFEAAHNSVTLTPDPDEHGTFDFVNLDFGGLRITFLKNGEPVRLGVPSKDPIRSHDFIVDGPGVNSYQVADVELPHLSYASNEPIFVRVTLHPHYIEIPADVPPLPDADAALRARIEKVLLEDMEDPPTADQADTRFERLIDRLIAVVRQ